MTLLQMTNFRRPGDIQNMTVEDYDKMMSAAKVNPDRYKNLDKETRDVVDDNVIVNIRGKLDREFHVMISQDQRSSFDLLKKYRDRMDIHATNRHFFAL